MARVTEREDLKRLAKGPRKGQRLTVQERFMAPTPEARMRYIRFATWAARFYKGDKQVRFRGNDWRL